MKRFFYHKYMEWMHDSKIWQNYRASTPLLVYLGALATAASAYYAVTYLTQGQWLGGIGLVVLGVAVAVGTVRFYKFFRKMQTERAKARQQVLDAAALTGSEQVLDMGCGSGLILNGVAQQLTNGGRAVGIDIWRDHSGGGNLKMLQANARAEGVADRIEFKHMDARQMTFEEDSFDVIVSNSALHHISHKMVELRQIIADIARMLRPGGRLVLRDVDAFMVHIVPVMEEFGLKVETRDVDPSATGHASSIAIGLKAG